MGTAIRDAAFRGGVGCHTPATSLICLPRLRASPVSTFTEHVAAYPAMAFFTSPLENVSSAESISTAFVMRRWARTYCSWARSTPGLWSARSWAEASRWWTMTSDFPIWQPSPRHSTSRGLPRQLPRPRICGSVQPWLRGTIVVLHCVNSAGRTAHCRHPDRLCSASDIHRLGKVYNRMR